MKKTSYAILLFFITTMGLYAQMQTAHWYFGRNVGLDFTNGSPVVVTDGQISTIEGCTSISDEYGNLLFYTDGRRIFDRTHNIMQNGTGLRGDISSTSSAIVLPVPDDCNLYYVFTIDVQDDEVPAHRPKRGMEYNIVDMSLNGGFGAVTEKNIEVPINGIQQGYEKLAAISNADKTGYWIITHFEENFYAFAVTSSGVNLTPVVSPSSIPEFDVSRKHLGYLKGSPDGSKLGMGTVYDACYDMYLSVYDFDNATGVVSNEIILYQPDPNTDLNLGFYGIEFSANNKVLYTTAYSSTCDSNGIVLLAKHEIWQYDLEAPSVADSKYVIQNTHYGALQRALDGKIYNADFYAVFYFLEDDDPDAAMYIGVIENPEIVYNPVTGEAPVYNSQGVNFGTSLLHYPRGGLPTFLNHYFRISITINGVANTGLYCAGDVLDFGFCSQGGEIQAIHWDFGDGTTSTEMYPLYTYNTTGTHTVIITLMIDGEEYVRIIEFDIAGPEAYDAFLEVCNTGETHTFSLTTALPQINPDNENYIITFHTTEQEARNNGNPLQNNFTTDTNTVIYVRIENADGCYVVRELELLFYEQPVIQTDNIVNICPGTSTVLSVTTAATNTINWYSSASETTPVFTGNNYETPELTTDTSYWVEVVSQNGCNSERIEIKIRIIIDEAPYFNLKQLYCINEQAEYLPTVSDNGIRGSWNPAVINTSILGTQTYTFTSDPTDCTSVFQLPLTIEVKAIVTPEFNLVTEYFFGEAPQILPTVSDNGISGTWYDPYINTNISGTRSYAFIPNPGECAEVFLVEIKVINYPRFFTPNGDGVNDYWNIWGFTREHKAEIFIFDRYGKLLKQLLPPGQGWDGTHNGRLCLATDYWFTATYHRNGEKREVKGHFSLLR